MWPDCFLLAAERLAVAPGNCVVVEDAPVGVAAGRAAGMAVVGVTSGHSDEELRAAGAALTIASVGQLELVHLQDAMDS